MSDEAVAGVARESIPAPPGDRLGHDSDPDVVEVVIPGDRSKGETGRIVQGKPLDRAKPTTPPTPRSRSQLTGNEISVHVKHRGRFKYVRTLSSEPSPEELRSMVPQLRVVGGKVKLSDEYGNWRAFEVHPLHPLALAQEGYDADDDDDDGSSRFIFPPQFVPQPTAPIDWPALMTAAAPIVGSFFSFFIEAIRRPPPPAPAAPPSSGGMKEAIEALGALLSISQELRPEAPEPAEGVAGIIQALLAGLRPPGPPGGPAPFPMPPPGPYGPQPQPQPYPGPVVQPVVQRPVAGRPNPTPAAHSQAVHAAQWKERQRDPRIPVPPDPQNPARGPAPELDPAEQAAKRQLHQLAAQLGISLDDATRYLRGYCDGSWQAMLDLAEEGFRNAAQLCSTTETVGGDGDEASDQPGSGPE